MPFSISPHPELAREARLSKDAGCAIQPSRISSQALSLSKDARPDCSNFASDVLPAPDNS
jgi:hypothetical protein